jgi:hypothetical protein
VPDYKITVRQDTAGWTIVALMLIIGVVAYVALRGSAQASPGGASTTASLKVVPTMRYVIVSPTATKFARCKFGPRGAPFHSTSTALGYPNGRCWIGKLRSTWPIKISRDPQSEVLVWGYNAVPSDGGTQWRLCNRGADPAVACMGPGGRPGRDQFFVENFWAGGQNATGLTDATRCAATFTSSSSCLLSMGQSQSEGMAVIGPSRPDDNSTLWRIRIAWIAVPP